MAALTDDGAEVIGRVIDEGLVAVHRRNRGIDETVDVHAVYDVAGTAQAILANGASRVALQMPDYLLRDSTMLQTALRERCEDVLFFVMADTVFAPCCVDEITAQHCNADMIVKYGHSCLTATSRVPVHFVHNHVQADKAATLTANAHSSIAAFLDENDSNPACLVTQPSHRSLAAQLIPASHAARLVTAAAAPEAAVNDTHFVVSGEKVPETGHDLIVITDEEGVATQAYLWLEYQNAVDSGCRLLLLNTDGEQPAYVPRENPYLKVSKRLRQRHFLMESVKDAEVIAIVVVSLAIADYAETVERVKSIIHASGKQGIVVYVGKPNVPKFANYEEVDAYCVVACPQSTWFDTKEYPKPVLTPVEVACALGEADNDTEDNALLTPQYYSLELSAVLRHYATAANAAPDVSLLTGCIRGGADDTTPEAPEEGLDAEGQLQAYKARELVAFQQSPIVSRLQSRQFKGLERGGDNTVQDKVEEGLSGIASSYASEPVVEKRKPAFVDPQPPQ
eukprot:Rhum_TRINITY_DN7192_c0_g1::Rhum_TRINITY_DN7192_c0_g1_i1::g.22076::m.22076/K17866/DPH2; diphthamide biosynthesis protein 2